MDEMVDLLINMNRYQLNCKEHIKKYNKFRHLHSEIINSMLLYFFSDKYDDDAYFELIADELKKEKIDIEIDLFSGSDDDINIIIELFMYKNHKNMLSITEMFLEQKRFRNVQKVKLLEAMNNSYVSLFKVVNADSSNGYVMYEDVFTKKRFKIIDVSMSSSFQFTKGADTYLYNRIITIDGISFGTGIHCIMTSDNKYLMEFIKKYKNKKISNFAKCLMLYDISKKDKKMNAGYNTRYGYR